jgi:hypothetical protein
LEYRPQGTDWQAARTYRGETPILETGFVTATGRARLIDFVPRQGKKPHIIRIVEGYGGSPLNLELAVRFDYGSRIPWVHRVGSDLEFVAGPESLRLHSERR